MNVLGKLTNTECQLWSSVKVGDEPTDDKDRHNQWEWVHEMANEVPCVRSTYIVLYIRWREMDTTALAILFP